MGLNVDHLIREYGCAIVFAFAALQAFGAPLPGTTALVAAALYAATDHGLPIAGVTHRSRKSAPTRSQRSSDARWTG